MPNITAMVDTDKNCSAKTITPHAMSLFSKLFGDSKTKTEPLMIPEGATSCDVISIAISSVIQQAGGNCVTLESIAEPSINPRT